MAMAGVMVTLYANRTFHMTFAQAGPTAFSVRILHTNDHHARIEPVLDANNAPLHGGVARRKTLIDAQRTNAGADKDVLLLDAGDVFQGTLYFNEYDGLADLEFYKAMRYQAITIGNHEFDKGPQVLANFITQAADPAFTPAVNPSGSLAGAWSIPVISANIVTTSASPLNGMIVQNTLITLEKGAAAGKKIGIFGLTPPDTNILSSVGEGITFIGDTDPASDNTELVNVINQQVADLQSQGANAVIALTHVGYPLDLALAAKTAGISLFIGGHTHTPLGPQPNSQGAYPTSATNTSGDNVPVLTDWEWGRWLGVFDVGFDEQGRVSEITGVPIEVIAAADNAGHVTPDAAFEARINNDYKPPLDALRQELVGATQIALDGQRNNVRSRETNLGSMIADVLLQKTAPDGAQVAITNGGGIRASIPVGDVSLGHVLDVLPFGNTIALVTLTGEQLLAALENGVSQVELGAGRFPQVAGLRFTFTPSYPRNSRVLEVEIEQSDGSFVALDPAATYRVATNNFMLNGGDGYASFTEGQDRVDTGFIMADVVVDYIRANSPITESQIALGRITMTHLFWLPALSNTLVPSR
jgi:5'-nucleotidase